jgi:hypothetical protein
MLANLLRSVESRKATEDGLRLQFAAKDGTLPAIAQAIDAERHCCRFLRFSVTVEPDGGPVTLELTGPPGTREFLESLLDDTPTSNS